MAWRYPWSSWRRRWCAAAVSYGREGGRMAVEVLAPPAAPFGELSIPREYVIAQQGREYILSDGLLVGLVQLSRGHYDLSTEIVQLPTAENAQTAVVTAKVAVFDPETGNTLRLASGIGDASPANTGRM